VFVGLNSPSGWEILTDSHRVRPNTHKNVPWLHGEILTAKRLCYDFSVGIVVEPEHVRAGLRSRPQHAAGAERSTRGLILQYEQPVRHSIPCLEGALDEKKLRGVL